TTWTGTTWTGTTWTGTTWTGTARTGSARRGLIGWRRGGDVRHDVVERLGHGYLGGRRGAWSRDRDRGHRQPGYAQVAAQQVLVEPLQGRARGQAELRRQQLPQVVVFGERLGLPAAAVQRRQVLAAQPFAQRVLPHHRFDLVEYLRVVAEHELSVEPVLVGGEPAAVQAGRLLAQDRGHPQVRQRPAAPQPERLPHRAGRRVRV